jgi:hypothetical protein
MSKHLSIPVTHEFHTGASALFRDVSTEALLEELTRRARGCLIVVAENHRESHQWRYRIKGSRQLMNAMSAGLTLEMHTELLLR